MADYASLKDVDARIRPAAFATPTTSVCLLLGVRSQIVLSAKPKAEEP